MTGLLDLFRRPKATPKPKRDLAQIFVPVIFANGVDDDLPGLAAAVKNEAVQFDGTIFAPGEALEIHRRTLVFSTNGLYFIGAHDALDPARVPPGWTVLREADPSRPIRIDSCTLLFGLKVRP